MASASVFLVESTCDFSENHTDLPVLVISFVFLIAFTLIFVFWFKGIKSRRSMGRFPVLAFTIGLVAAFMYVLPFHAITHHHGHSSLILAHRNYSLLITSLFILHCTLANAVVNWDGLQTGSFIANSIQNLVNLGIVLIYIIPLATNLTWPYTLANKVVLAIIGAIFLPFVIINTLDYLAGYVINEDVTVPSLNVTLNLSAAYYFLLLCVATYCVCVLIFYRFRRRTDDNPRKVS